MARIEANAAGQIVRFVAAKDEVMAAHPQASGAPVLFDDVSNAALLVDLSASTDPYTIIAGTLRKNGSPVTIVADHPSTTDAKNVKANATAIFAALRAGAATNAQIQRVLAFLLRREIQG